jgi:hypothetical protein
MSRFARVPIVEGLAALGAAALLGCAVATPEQAHRAERECFDEARHDEYRQLEMTGTPLVVGNEVVLQMKARRHGDEFTGSCTYDQDRRHAKVTFGQQGGGGDDWMVDKARDACREEAEDRRYRVDRMSDERAKHDHVRLNMDLSRRGDRYFARCHYERGRADLEIEDA